MSYNVLAYQMFDFANYKRSLSKSAEKLAPRGQATVVLTTPVVPQNEPRKLKSDYSRSFHSILFE